jgi:1,2-diacylglycerol 3-alpha-glucosyltransferase
VRVLFVSDVYFPRVNGVSTSIETFRRDLLTLGHDVTLVAPRYPDSSQKQPADDASIVRVPARAVPRDPEDRAMSWTELRQTLTRLGQRKFDVVHVHTPFLAHYAGLRFARQFNTPLIATYHTLFEEYLHHYVPMLPRAFGRAVARRLSRSQCNQLDTVIAPSQAMHDALKNYGVDKTIEILPTGLPEERFQLGDGAAFRRRHGIPPDRPLLLFVGRAAHEKNIGFLIDMMCDMRRLNPKALLLIAGEGPALPSLRARADQLGLAESVRFMGYFDRGDELRDCYSAADVFVFASLTETQGLVLLEAMAQSVPVVAIPRMGTIDILAPLLGCRHATENPQAFATVVHDLLADKELRATLAAQARQYAQSWASKKMAERLGSVYARMARDGL